MKIIKQIFAITIALFVPLSVWAADDGPKEAIEGTVGQIIEALNARQDKSTLSKHDRDTISKVVKGRFDYQAMAISILGKKAWSKLSASEQVDFTEVFRQTLERTYANRLAKYNGQSVKFTKVKFSKKKPEAKVKSLVIDGGRKTPVIYRMRKTDLGWQVIDFQIESFKMVHSFRNQYRPVLKEKGYGQLLKSLKDKIATQKANEAS